MRTMASMAFRHKICEAHFWEHTAWCLRLGVFGAKAAATRIRCGHPLPDPGSVTADAPAPRCCRWTTRLHRAPTAASSAGPEPASRESPADSVFCPSSTSPGLIRIHEKGTAISRDRDCGGVCAGYGQSARVSRVPFYCQTGFMPLILLDIFCAHHMRLPNFRLRGGDGSKTMRSLWRFWGGKPIAVGNRVSPVPPHGSGRAR